MHTHLFSCFFVALFTCRGAWRNPLDLLQSRVDLVHVRLKWQDGRWVPRCPTWEVCMQDSGGSFPETSSWLPPLFMEVTLRHCAMEANLSSPDPSSNWPFLMRCCLGVRRLTRPWRICQMNSLDDRQDGGPSVAQWKPCPPSLPHLWLASVPRESFRDASEGKPWLPPPDFLKPMKFQLREGDGTPLQYSCLEKSHGWRSLVGCSPWGRKESDTTERLHFHFSLSCIGEGNGNPLQCSCLENPRDRGAFSAAVYGVA